jgi:hypothetical protein
LGAAVLLALLMSLALVALRPPYPTAQQTMLGGLSAHAKRTTEQVEMIAQPLPRALASAPRSAGEIVYDASYPSFGGQFNGLP